jgi:hypothetical protein
MPTGQVLGGHCLVRPGARTQRPSGPLQESSGPADVESRRPPSGLKSLGVQLGVRGATRYVRTRLGPYGSPGDLPPSGGRSPHRLASGGDDRASSGVASSRRWLEATDGRADTNEQEGPKRLERVETMSCVCEGRQAGSAHACGPGVADVAVTASGHLRLGPASGQLRVRVRLPAAELPEGADQAQALPRMAWYCSRCAGSSEARAGRPTRRVRAHSALSPSGSRRLAGAPASA